MYNVQPPKIHLSRVVGYDRKNRKYIVEDEKTFDTERDLICFLANHNRPVYNYADNPIKGKYKNKYLDNQALNGASRRSLYGPSLYDEVVHMLYPHKVPDIHYLGINMEWKINEYLFWIDAPWQPNFDVRNLRDKVNAEYLRQTSIKIDWFRYIKMNSKKKHKKRQGRRHHKCYPWRDDARYIQRARAAYGMEADEEEYKRLVKKKDKEFRSVWPDEDFRGYSSTGWKDNSGNRYRHQWEPKAEREFKRKIKSKEIATDSCKYKSEDFIVMKKARTKEELEAEVKSLQKKLKC